MQKLSMLELDMVSGGGHILVVVDAPAHYVADRGHIDLPGRVIVANAGGVVIGGGSGDICN